MRFNEYITSTLNEKVSAKEIDEALMNPNITIGVEFEFIVDEMKEYVNTDIVEGYDSAYRDFEDWQDEMREYHRDYKNLQRDLEKMNDKLDDLKSELQDSIDERDEIEEDDSGYKRKYVELERKIGQYEDRIEELESELEDKETERDEMEMPYPGQDYMDYMSDCYHNYNYGSNPSYFSEEDDFGTPPHPQDLVGFSLDDEDKWKEAAEGLRPLFNTLPIPNNYEIEGYGHSDGKTWSIKYDSSIAEEGGVELVSPILNIFEFMKLTPEIFKWIDKHGDTSSSCGFHVHMGLKGVSNLKDVLDPIKLVLMTDEDYIWKYFDERKLNDYTKSMKGPIYQRGIKSDDIKELINWENLKREVGVDHYAAINFENWEEGHIEFRHMGGQGYHKKFKEVLTIVAREAHALSVGVDPDYKRKEYIVKLSRLANKLEALQLIYVRETFKRFLDEVNDDKVVKHINNEISKIDKRISSIGPIKGLGEIFNKLKGVDYEMLEFANKQLVELIVKPLNLSSEYGRFFERRYSTYGDIRKMVSNSI